MTLENHEAWPTMTTTVTDKIRDRIERIVTTPSIPAVFLPLVDLLSGPAEEANLDEVVRLVSYDNAIAAQCLRVASSPLFGMVKPPKSIAAAVMTLGLQRVETIVLTSCMGEAFSREKWGIDPVAFWRHSLGCAMVSRKFSEKLAGVDGERAYMAGLLHDLGFLASSMAFPEEFAVAVARACREQIPLHEAEQATMGFTHCETGRALAEKWHLAKDILDVIAHHHAPTQAGSAGSLVALVHLSDELCRVRGLDYGYYERHKVDLISDPAWSILLQDLRDLEGVDLARFTFELDESAAKVGEMVSAIFGPVAA